MTTTKAHMRPTLARALAASLPAFTLATFIGSTTAAAEQQVNIYSYREPSLIAPLMDAFSKKSGIKTNIVFAKDGLTERIKAEGANSPADVLLTVDIARMSEAKEAGITQPLKSSVIDAAIPANYRDPEGAWVGLSQRARVVFASRERVKQDAITYEELADPKWRGKVCSRSGQHSYNTGLLGSIIAHSGAEKAQAWAAGVKANLARKPAGGDRDQAKSIFAGECDVAIANTYYMAAMETSDKPEQREWAKSIKILFPNAADRGTHVNISGAILAKNAPNKDAGVKLIEFLASDEGQKIYAEAIDEYPLKEGLSASERVKAWGVLKADMLPLDAVAKNRKTASEIMDKVGFDQGPGA